MEIKQLSLEDFPEILRLTRYLNPGMEDELLSQRLKEMFNYSNFLCFGCYEDDKLLGLAGLWNTVRLYSGKQIELDNVIIDPEIQSKGTGHQFLQLIEDWAIQNNYESIELNAYTSNRRSHKFYHKEGFEVYGFHFIKKMKK